MIVVENLGRHFGSVKAVDDISFGARKGEVLGFLGPNGAGKSTTMKMLTSFLTPSFGKATIGGHDVVLDSRKSRALIGYLPENAPLYSEMTPRQFLLFCAQMRNISNPASALERVVSLTGIQQVLDRKIETLSKGFKRRVGLCQALIHDPEVLILDEPTDGLDPNQKFEVRSLINGMAKDKCIILSTHILEEVDACCNRVVIISGGKIVADANPTELRAKARSFGAVSVRVLNVLPEAVKKQLLTLSSVGDVTIHSADATASRITVYPRNHGDDQLLKTFLSAVEINNWKVDSIRMESGHLDEVFRELTTTAQ